MLGATCYVLRADVAIRIGISACLLGQEVRYDGGHKRNQSLVDALRRHFELVPVCPELEVGMGVPREPVRLVREGGGLRMRTVDSNIDYTDVMNHWSSRRLEALAAQDLAGFVLKKDSPSCGLAGVKTYSQGEPARDGRGLFAAALMNRFPEMPAEDEERLADPKLLDNFIQRVFAYHTSVRQPND